MNTRKLAVCFFSLAFLLSGCDNSDSSSSDDSSHNPTPTPPTPTPPDPTPVITKPVAKSLVVSNQNGTLTGSYQYSNEDGSTEGKSMVYWRSADAAVIATGKTYNVTSSTLNTPLSFCVVVVSNEGMQGEEVCSTPYTVTSVALTPTFSAATTIPGQLNLYKNITIIPDLPAEYNLVTLSPGFSGNQYIAGYRDVYDGYNLNDIGVFNRTNNTFGIANYTPRTIVDPVIRVKLKSDGAYHWYKINFTLPQFSQVELDSTTAPFQFSDVEEAQFIDPNPVYPMLIDHFAKPDGTTPPDPSKMPVETESNVFAYNKNFYFSKFFFNRYGALSNFVDTYTDPACEEGYYYCMNHDFSVHGWGRMIKNETNTVNYQDSGAEQGKATVGGTGLLTISIVHYDLVDLTDTMEHERGHNLGYGHLSGFTYSYPSIFIKWMKAQPYYSYIPGDSTTSQTLNENSDYVYETSWVNNTTIKVVFHAKVDTAMPLTNLGIVADDEQDPTYKDNTHPDGGDNSGNVGVGGHENNNFGVKSVEQINKNTLLITLNNPMRYAGNSLVIYAEPAFSGSFSGYVTARIYNSNDIGIPDNEVGAFMVDALNPEFKQQVYYNGSTSFLSTVHSQSNATNYGLGDAVAGSNLYNFRLENYQSWSATDALAYCQKLGRTGLAKISIDNTSLTNLQNKYLNNSAIVALDDSGTPAVFKGTGTDPKGQLIACSLN